MTRQRLEVPERSVWEYAHGLANKLAREQLATIDDIEEKCRKSGARHLPAEHAVIVDYLGTPYRISYPVGDVSLADSGEDVSTKDALLVLHYFLHATGTPLSGKTITYKELHDGINYYPTFFKRSIQPLVDTFGNEPERLVAVAEVVGGKRADFDDVSVTVNVFPNVPLTLVLRRGDEEFPPDGSILFDSTIREYLPIEDITVISEAIAWKLVKLSKTGGDSSGHR